MLSEQRQYEISEFIRQEGTASIIQLAERFGVSGETIRRDLNVIAKDGSIRKVHGGAVAVRRSVRDDSYAVRQTHNAYHKQKIGERAVALLCDNDIIAIDSGTCAEAFAKAIYNVSGLKIVTHSMPVAAILAKKIAAGDFTGDVVLLGGSVSPETGTLGGAVTLTQLQALRVNKAFIAVTAISASGLSAGTETDGIMSSELIRRSDISYALAESEKLDKQSFYHVADFDEINGVITDDEHTPSEELRKALGNSGTEWISATVRLSVRADRGDATV
ncbi:MAG: DeoR/GlpR transcriptional regulator [Clostridia bacterium]|nr:DeoR/GlpR transcriptional regulator [Clostridia bacterium]